MRRKKQKKENRKEGEQEVASASLITKKNLKHKTLHQLQQNSDRTPESTRATRPTIGNKKTTISQNNNDQKN